MLGRTSEACAAESDATLGVFVTGVADFQLRDTRSGVLVTNFAFFAALNAVDVTFEGAWNTDEPRFRHVETFESRVAVAIGHAGRETGVYSAQRHTGSYVPTFFFRGAFHTDIGVSIGVFFTQACFFITEGSNCTAVCGTGGGLFAFSGL